MSRSILRDAHHLALNTAQAAIRILAAGGLVEIRPAKDTYVRDGRPWPVGFRSWLQAGPAHALRPCRRDATTVRQRCRPQPVRT
jgi:DNA-binding FadR family transcriptional regulator